MRRLQEGAASAGKQETFFVASGEYADSHSRRGFNGSGCVHGGAHRRQQPLRVLSPSRFRSALLAAPICLPCPSLYALPNSLQISDVLIIRREKRGVLSSAEKTAIGQGYKRVPYGRTSFDSFVDFDTAKKIQGAREVTQFYAPPHRLSLSRDGGPCITSASCKDDVNAALCDAFVKQCAKSYRDSADKELIKQCDIAWKNLLLQNGETCIDQKRIDEAREDCVLPPKPDESSKTDHLRENLFPCVDAISAAIPSFHGLHGYLLARALRSQKKRFWKLSHQQRRLYRKR